MPRIVLLDQKCTKPMVFPEESNGDVVSYHEGDLTICADNLHYNRAIPQDAFETNRRATRSTPSPGNTKVVKCDVSVSDKDLHRPSGIGGKSTSDEESISESGDDEQFVAEPSASTAAMPGAGSITNTAARGATTRTITVASEVEAVVSVEDTPVAIIASQTTTAAGSTSKTSSGETQDNAAKAAASGDSSSSSSDSSSSSSDPPGSLVNVRFVDPIGDIPFPLIQGLGIKSRDNNMTIESVRSTIMHKRGNPLRNREFRIHVDFRDGNPLSSEIILSSLLLHKIDDEDTIYCVVEDDEQVSKWIIYQHLCLATHCWLTNPQQK